MIEKYNANDFHNEIKLKINEIIEESNLWQNKYMELRIEFEEHKKDCRDYMTLTISGLSKAINNLQKELKETNDWLERLDDEIQGYDP